jgi:predicted nucleic acid-binding protein
LRERLLEEPLTFFEAKKLELVTSSITAREIARYKGLKKGDIERVHASLAQVHFIEDHEVVGFQSSWDRFGGESYPLVQDDPTSSALRKMKLDRTDAHHMMLAIRAGCDRFITYDNGILNRSSQIESALKSCGPQSY